MSADTAVSKTMSYWLRHRPDNAGLVLDSHGWAATDAVIAALHAQGLDIDGKRLAAIVADSDKGHFELSPDNNRIRARQGHSVRVTLDWPRTEPPAILYHGTVVRSVPAILADGLKPMARHHVDLSADRGAAALVGGRRGKPVILAVRSGDIAAGGH
ncbi:MAG TPA: RNA 2'-phosphotransferase [Sphingomonas sp.]|jgi:putative RNA 2'-phosphotransferase